MARFPTPYVVKQAAPLLAPNDARHGTFEGYLDCGCRCAYCRRAGRSHTREKLGLPPDQTAVAWCPWCHQIVHHPGLLTRVQVDAHHDRVMAEHMQQAHPDALVAT